MSRRRRDRRRRRRTGRRRPARGRGPPGQRVRAAPTTVGGKLGDPRTRRVHLRHRSVAADPAACSTDLFAATGGPADLEMTPVDPACGYRFADGTRLDLPLDPAAVPAALDAALGPGAGAAWRGVHDRSRPAVGPRRRAGAAPAPRAPATRAVQRPAARPARGRPVADPRGSAGQLLPDPRLRMWLDRYATYSGSDPRRTPSVLSVTPFVEQRVRRVVGARRPAPHRRRPADRCRELGVAVHLDSAVAAVRRRGGAGCRGAPRTAGPCPRTSSSATPTPASSTSGCCPGARRGRAGRLRRARVLAGFVLLLALDGPARRVRRTASGSRPTTTPSSTRCSAAARTRARPDRLRARPRRPGDGPDPAREAWFVLVNAPVHDPAGGVDWDAPGLRERYADRVLEVLAHAARTSAAGSAGGRSAPRPTSSAAPPRPAARSTAPRRTGHGPRCSAGEPRPCPGSTSSAAPRTPAAGCRSC